MCGLEHNKRVTYGRCVSRTHTYTHKKETLYTHTLTHVRTHSFPPQQYLTGPPCHSLLPKHEVQTLNLPYLQQKQYPSYHPALLLLLLLTMKVWRVKGTHPLLHHASSSLPSWVAPHHQSHPLPRSPLRNLPRPPPLLRPPVIDVCISDTCARAFTHPQSSH